MGLHIELLEVGPSIGVVAGFISGGLTLVHQAIPLAFAFILIALVYKKEFNATTWSAIARHIQKSILPTVIFADGGISWLLSPSIFIICCLSIIIAVLVPIASFMTPIPLTNTVIPASGSIEVEFQYIPDLSLYGQATPARPLVPIKRTCNHGNLYGDCPNSIYDDPTVRLEYPGHVVVNSSIPAITTHPYASNSMASTVAGPLQIQYRNWFEGNYTYVDNGKTRIIGNPRPIRSLVLEDGYQLVEGLVIDATNGGVGFRNHTVPVGMTLGAEWEEDILWVEPVTACSPTNLSLHFSISLSGITESTDGYLKDDGGFSVLSQNPPTPRWDDDYDLQNNWRAIGFPPDLANRASVAAFWNNRFVAEQLGVESSQIGQIYTEQLQNYGGLASPSSLVISDINGDFLDNNFFESTESNRGNFTAYGYRCSGYDDQNPSTTSKAYVRCGYLLSVPVPLNEQAAYSQSRRYDLGSNWTQQLYTCASSMKASVKTVTFRFNGTQVFEGLEVVDVKSKDYSNTPLPRWGLENAWGFAINDLNTFWGLTNGDTVSNANLAVYEAEEIYLPATNRYTGFSQIFDSFAAGGAFGAAWNGVYDWAAAVRGTSMNLIPSYSGETNYAETLKWRRLSETSEGATNILNLIWTDLVAAAVVGTVTGFEDSIDEQPLRKRSTNSQSLGRRNVRPMIHKIGYSNILYAIPAMALGGILVFAMLICLVFLLCGRLSPRRLEYYTNQTSLGRALAQVQHPGAAPTDASSSEWKKLVGKRIIHVPRLPPRKGWRKKASRNSWGSSKTQDTAKSFAMSNLSNSSNTGYEPLHVREQDPY